VEKNDSGLLADHMLMDCDDVDTRRAQSLQNTLELSFTHRASRNTDMRADIRAK
jgi:hypothetical protein